MIGVNKNNFLFIVGISFLCLFSLVTCSCIGNSQNSDENIRPIINSESNDTKYKDDQKLLKSSLDSIKEENLYLVDRKGISDALITLSFLALGLATFILVPIASSVWKYSFAFTEFSNFNSLLKFSRKMELNNEDKVNLLKYTLEFFVFLKYDKENNELYIFDQNEKRIMLFSTSDIDYYSVSEKFEVKDLILVGNKRKLEEIMKNKEGFCFDNTHYNFDENGKLIITKPKTEFY